jgi:HlyD family secretion protein
MSENDPKSKIFRKVALDRLSSPEQLDSLMRVITPKAWLALSPLIVLILGAFVWGWFGSLPNKILATKCILINSIGLADVSSESSGRITDLMVKVGDVVEKGRDIARIEQPDLNDRIQKAESRVYELQSQKKVVNSFAAQGEVLSQQTIGQQKQVLESQISVMRERAKYAQERMRLARERTKVQEELFQQGLVTNQSVLAARQEAANARQDEAGANLEVESLQNQIEQLKLTRLERDKQMRGEIANIDTQLNEALRQLDSLVGMQKIAGTVISRYTGKVTEIKAGKGMLIGAGSPVITIELNDSSKVNLEAVIYIPLSEGRKVLPKMDAQIVPSTVKREESGFIRANIRQVSDYPATPGSMMLLMQNEALVRDLSGQTPPTEIRASLITAESYSGYQWSSLKGPPIKLASGTICSAEITLDSQRPLSLVIPILKSTLGIS